MSTLYKILSSLGKKGLEFINDTEKIHARLGAGRDREKVLSTEKKDNCEKKAWVDSEGLDSRCSQTLFKLEELKLNQMEYNQMRENYLSNGYIHTSK